nr:unnamed protein product [Digitaria exilis]
MLLGAARMEEKKRMVMGRERDQFPVGMRVLAVDDDPVCLKVLETLLRRCQYHVLSVNGETKSVMKGITHGACDYLLKPVRIEELRNIWQHVVRRKFSKRERSNLEIYKEFKLPSTDSCHGHNQIVGGASDQSGRISKKRKEMHSDEEDDGDENDFQEGDELSAAKKPRVVWSVELHRKFVAAVNQLGIDKAVPKRILELMNVEKLTRENVASHLQRVTSTPLPPQELLECTQAKLGIQASMPMPSMNSELVERTVGVSSNLQDSRLSQQGALPINDGFSADKLQLHDPFDGTSGTKFSVTMPVCPSGSLTTTNNTKSGASSCGTVLLAPDTGRHSNYLQFGEMKIHPLTSDDKLKQKNIYDFGIPKLHGGFSSSSCNFDGLLSSMIKAEKDDLSFADNDLGGDFFPLGACI